MNNSPELSRRHFLKTTTGLALATGTLGADLSALAAARAKPWPVACRDAHLKATGKPDSWAAMRALGLTGVEVDIDPDLLCPGLFHPQKKYSLATAEGVQSLQADLEENGAVITAFCMSNRFDERLERELDWAKKLVPIAQKLNVRAIRIDVVPRALPRDQFLPFAIKACKQLCDIAEGTPVRFGIENHGNTTNDPAFLDRLFNGVGSDRLGLTLDTGNFYWFGHPLNDLYGLFSKFAPRAVHTHCKSIRYPEDRRNARRPMGWEYGKYCAPIYDGDIDYPKLVAILRKANYQGDLCLEDEALGHFPKDQQADVLKKEIAMLHRLALS